MQHETIRNLVDYFVGHIIDRDFAAARNYWFNLQFYKSSTSDRDKLTAVGKQQRIITNKNRLIESITNYLLDSSWHHLLAIARKANYEAKQTPNFTREGKYAFKWLMLNVLIVIFQERYLVLGEDDERALLTDKPFLFIQRDKESSFKVTLHFHSHLRFRLDNRLQVSTEKMRGDVKAGFHIPIHELAPEARAIVEKVIPSTSEKSPLADYLPRNQLVL